ncbi:MAG: hypothetical protein NTX42_07000 [Methanothrix sp.]|nr:hypothetical protein [Methanothrix sp.]
MTKEIISKIIYSGGVIKFSIYILLPIAINIFTTILFYLIDPNSLKLNFSHILNYFLIITLSLIIISFLAIKWAKYYFKGIEDVVESTVSGKGSASSVLSEANSDFMLMAIAARKWIDTGALMDKKMRDFGTRRGNLKFLLLNPNSDECKRLSISQGLNEDHVSDLIIKTLKGLAEKSHNKYLNIEIRLYDFMPIFRIVIIDEKTIYLGFYRAGTTGGDSFQLILKPVAEQSLYKPIKEYFITVWDSKDTKKVNLNQVNEKGYLESLR